MSQINNNIDLYSINADKLAQLRYGVDRKYNFPGKQLNNLDNFNNLCFDTVAEFVDPLVMSPLDTPAGQKCQIAMLQQMNLTGRLANKINKGNVFRLPVTLSRPQYFKEALEKTGNIEESYKMCLNSCMVNESPLNQNKCVERCGNARDALILTVKPEIAQQIQNSPEPMEISASEIQYNQPSGYKTNNNCGGCSECYEAPGTMLGGASDTVESYDVPDNLKDAPEGSSSSGMSAGIIALIVICGCFIVGIFIFMFWGKSWGNSENRSKQISSQKVDRRLLSN